MLDGRGRKTEISNIAFLAFSTSKNQMPNKEIGYQYLFT
jgi:hypothetical protein